MKVYILSLLMLCTVLTLNSCKKTEEVLTPSDNTLEVYSLPQGNAAYDQTIVDYYGKYGVYMLYKFTEKDAYWTPTAFKKPVQSIPGGAWSAGAEVEASDPAYITYQLALIKSKWFGFYTDKFLKKFLPTKILLCKKVDSISNGFVFGGPTVVYVKQAKKVPAFYNYDNIQVNYGDETVKAMTVAQQRLFIYKTNLIFIQSIIARGLTVPTTEFATSADYVTAMTTYAQSYGKGIIVPYNAASAQLDWNAYMTAMVTYSTVQLNTSTVITDSTPMGILNATKDTNGQIKKRYNIVRNYYINEYGVDLQLIGNATRGL